MLPPVSYTHLLKEALKGTDVEAIKKAQEELQTAFYAVAERIYKEQVISNIRLMYGDKTLL